MGNKGSRPEAPAPTRNNNQSFSIRRQRNRDRDEQDMNRQNDDGNEHLDIKDGNISQSEQAKLGQQAGIESKPPTSLPKAHHAVSTIYNASKIPMEMIELIIDNLNDGATFLACSLVCKEWLARCRYYIFSRISVPAAFCVDRLRILDPSKVTAHSSRGVGSQMAKGKDITLPPAGIFVQSLSITPSAQFLLSPSTSVDPSCNPSIAAKLLLDSLPNVRELQLTGVTAWSIAHFLEPLSATRRLEDLTLLDIRCDSWADIAKPLSLCVPTLKSLRIGGFRFKPPPKNKANARKLTTSAANPSEQFPTFPLLRRLAIELERDDSKFIDELLGDISRSPSGGMEHLEILELQLDVASRSNVFMRQFGKTVHSLKIHCDGLKVGTSGIPVEIGSYPLDLRNLPLLRILHFCIPADYVRPTIVSHCTLVQSLSKFPYSTITTLRLSFRTSLGYASYSQDQWRELDDTLSMPHLASVTCVELLGLGSIYASVRSGLPKACARGIVHFLW